MGTSGRTQSTRCAAMSAMRRPPHEGQKPRRLHEKGTRRSQLAGIAVQSQEAVRQHTAAEVGPKLLLDESGCGLASFPSAREKGLELFANDALEKGLLRGSERVAGRPAVSSRPKSGMCSIRPCAFEFARVSGRALAHRSRRCVRGSCRCVGPPQGLGWLAGFPRSRRARQRSYSGARSSLRWRGLHCEGFPV